MTAVSVVVIDQLTKFIASGKQLAVIRNFLYIRYLQNTGIGFGLLQEQSASVAFLTLIFIGAVLYYYDTIPAKKPAVVFVALLLGGAVGNMIDRFAFGFVRDFIAFTFWPAFNIADMAITIGGIGIIIYLWQKKK